MPTKRSQTATTLCGWMMLRSRLIKSQFFLFMAAGRINDWRSGDGEAYPLELLEVSLEE
jgi:hypothetical protein